MKKKVIMDRSNRIHDRSFPEVTVKCCMIAKVHAPHREAGAWSLRKVDSESNISPPFPEVVHSSCQLQPGGKGKIGLVCLLTGFDPKESDTRNGRLSVFNLVSLHFTLHNLQQVKADNSLAKELKITFH